MEKILVIEDEPQIRASIQEILTLSDFEIILAADGKTGVWMAKEYIPDLIVCDIMMPELTGHEVLAELRQDEVTCGIPLIFLTAQSQHMEVRRGMEQGASDYLAKPFSPSELLRAVTAQLAKQKITQRGADAKLERLRTNISTALPQELHTSLKGILGMSTLLSECHSGLSTDEVVDVAQTIQESAIRLDHLTQNFLLYTELELIAANPEKLREFQNCPERIFAKAVISRIAKLKAHQAGRKEDLQLDVQSLPISISEKSLSKIVEELVDNAFKFSNSGTIVKVNSWFDATTFTLYITNHGAGMMEAQIAQLETYVPYEQKFYEQQGLGLGLVITKRLIELHGGKLNISSVPDEKTVVQVVFPR